MTQCYHIDRSNEGSDVLKMRQNLGESDKKQNICGSENGKIRRECEDTFFAQTKKV